MVRIFFRQPSETIFIYFFLYITWFYRENVKKILRVKLTKHFWAHLCVCTVGSYASLSVCDLIKIQTRPKVTCQKIISQELFHWGSPNFVRAWTWMTLRSTLKVKVIGQGHQLKNYFRCHFKNHRVSRFGQSMDVDDLKVDLEGQGRRSKVHVTNLKNYFRYHFKNHTLHSQCSLHLLYTTCTLPIHCR